MLVRDRLVHRILPLCGNHSTARGYISFHETTEALSFHPNPKLSLAQLKVIRR